ncbi:38003_t:CDS:2 [Gigaspora margarita]|uniref:38003_t:CDS:1 n=1 Tax=Gigaspora margarita TaxID=4874 RepID=A0ABN7UCY5_GIGMA|nr:38003_t:CDS:2 [Gigaspora margarita]
MLRLMSNTHKALDTIDHTSDFAELLDDKKISDLMSNLIDNKFDYHDEIYDQLINYTTSQSKNNDSEDKILVNPVSKFARSNSSNGL